jgi:type VI secretion system protein ImpA
MADIDIEKFLQSIPGENPSGVDLRYILYDELEEARRREDPAVVAKLDYGRDAKATDYNKVVKVAEDALINKSKDLQIAAWLTESWLYRYQISGLVSGLQLLKNLLDRFWDSVYPEIEDGDADLRVRPLNWLGSSFDPSFALRSVPLVEKRKFSWFAYQEAKTFGYESEANADAKRRAAREEAIKENKPTLEEFDRDFNDTPKPFYKKLDGDCKAALEAIQGLDDLCNSKFSDDPPSFGPLRTALTEVSRDVQVLLKKKLEKDPDPIEISAEVAEESAEGTEQDSTAAADGAGKVIDLAQFAGGEIKSSDQAVLHALAAAQFLRRKIPASPVPYLLLRALRWGEVRAAGDIIATELPAPSSDVRVKLRASAAGKNWNNVLETAETAMGSAVGRGWLDLQRYSIRACDELGYTGAAKALRSELKAFLLDFPQLPDATLTDDTGTANPETIAWLRQEGFIS